MKLKSICIYTLFLFPLPLTAETLNHFSLFLEKPKDLYSTDKIFKAQWEPPGDKKLFLDQIHPASQQKSFSLLYHWDFSKPSSKSGVTCHFFPILDLISKNSEDDIFENVKPKMPQGLFPIFRIDF